MGFLKRLFFPESDEDISRAIPLICCLFFICIGLGFYLQVFKGYDGAFSASGGVSLAICIGWSAWLYPYVFEVYMSARIQRHTFITTNAVVKLLLDSCSDLTKDQLDKQEKYVRDKREKHTVQVSETSASLRKLAKADAFILLVGTLIWALGGFL